MWIFNRHFDWRAVAVTFAVLMMIVYFISFYVGANRPLPAPPMTPSSGALAV